MNKQMLGFSWIELAAVITIIAIISALSIPKISTYIDDAKKVSYSLKM